MELQVQNKIIENLQYLDSFQLGEILDYVEYLKNKVGEQKRDSDTIDLLFGKYMNALSSSEEFARSKRTEKEKEERKWKTA
jgi:hypothetical protein